MTVRRSAGHEGRKGRESRNSLKLNSFAQIESGRSHLPLRGEGGRDINFSVQGVPCLVYQFSWFVFCLLGMIQVANPKAPPCIPFTKLMQFEKSADSAVLGYHEDLDKMRFAAAESQI